MIELAIAIIALVVVLRGRVYRAARAPRIDAVPERRLGRFRGWRRVSMRPGHGFMDALLLAGGLPVLNVALLATHSDGEALAASEWNEVVNQSNRRAFIDPSYGDPDVPVDASAAVWAAITSLRDNPVSILDTIGGNTITAYSSGVVEFPRGVYRVTADTVRITQDVGLTFKGQGSRGPNNSVRAATTILVTGASTGYGIQAYRSGGRGFKLQDIDVCYESATFTGHVVDVMDSPGLTLDDVFIGTYGLTSGTRLQTAASCLRATYDEFLSVRDTVFDGAVDGVWFDDARTELANTFGGSNSSFQNCVWYDFTGDMVRHDGLRTREVLAFRNCSFNSISVNHVRSIDLNNVEGLSLDACHFGPSTTFVASTEWLRLVNCTGVIQACGFNALSKAGTLNGKLKVSGNRVFCTDGFTVTGGILTGGGNEFSQGTNGWTFSPIDVLVFDLGPDEFKAAITGRSYDIPADSAFLAGRINYDSAWDASASKFRNVSPRVRILNVDAKQFTVADAAYAVSILDTGRTILATNNAAPQTFTLPTPTPGCVLSITRIGTQDLTVNCAGGTNFYTGTGATRTSAQALAANVGGTLVLEAFGSTGWVVKSQVGTWAYT